MRFASLGSGSRGNATLIEAGGTRVLVDCGFAAREAERRLGWLGVAADTLDAILVTHEHGDHVRGVGALSRRFCIPTWMTSGTYGRAGCGTLPRLLLFSSHGQQMQSTMTLDQRIVCRQRGELVGCRYQRQPGQCRNMLCRALSIA